MKSTYNKYIKTSFVKISFGSFQGLLFVAMLICFMQLGLPSISFAATSAELTEIETNLSNQEKHIEQMRGRYVKTLQIEKGRKFEHRFNQAKFLYESKDFVHASIVLSDLLNFPDAKTRQQYYDILWYFGDSLAHNKNYLSAKTYLEKVVDFGSQYSYFEKAIISLIRISIEMGRFQDAEKYYSSISNAGSSSSKGFDLIQYAYGKSLYKKGDMDRALRTFKQISLSSDKKLQAEYFAGVILVETKKLEEALEVFASLYKTNQTGELAESIKDLSLLASARILFELKKFDEALSLYRKIDFDSPYFDQAYYEITWIYIQKGKYAEGANTLDMLLLAMPESIYAPKSQLLKGNIHLWEGRFNEAGESFSLVINKYAEVVETLDYMLEKSSGKDAEVIQEILFGKDSSLPPVALVWLAQEEDVAAALEISTNLTTSHNDVEEAQKVVAALKMHLTQEAKANLFPVLKEGREEGVEVTHNLTLLRKQLVSIERGLVGSKLSDTDRQELAKVQKQRHELEMIYAKIPKTVKQRHNRHQTQVSSVEKVESQVYELTLQMKGIDEIINDVLSRHEKLSANPNMSKKYLKKVQQELKDMALLIEQMANELDGLNREVKVVLERTKIGDVSNNEDEKIRIQLEQVISKERKLLAKMRSKLTQNEAQTFDRIQQSKRKSDTLDNNLSVFFKDLESLVAERVLEFLKQVEMEQRMLMAYLGQLNVYRVQAHTMAANIAYNNLQTVRDRFYSIYLKANVGVVDIAWEKRQKIRDKIEGLLGQRSDEKDQLDRSFEGLR